MRGVIALAAQLLEESGAVALCHEGTTHLGEMAVMEICLVLHLPSNPALLPYVSGLAVAVGHYTTLHHSACPEIPTHYLERKTMLYGHLGGRYQRGNALLNLIHTQGRG